AFGVDAVANGPENLPIRPLFHGPRRRQIGRYERAQVNRQMLADVFASREGRRMTASAETVGNGPAALDLFVASLDPQLRHRRGARIILCVLSYSGGDAGQE